ncbi:MAG: Mobile element protein, partial [uncultured Acetobacteraceae bacterium]
GRDLHPSEGALDLPVSRGGQPRADHRFPALGHAGRGGGEALFPQGVRPAAHGQPAHDHGGQEPRMPARGRGDEARRRALAFLPTTPVQVPQQPRRAGPPACETSGQARARLRRLPDGATYAGRLRGHGDGQEGAGSKDRRRRHAGPSHLHRRSVPDRRL